MEFFKKDYILIEPNDTRISCDSAYCGHKKRAKYHYKKLVKVDKVIFTDPYKNFNRNVIREYKYVDLFICELCYSRLDD